jgi:hypothetical protein
MGSIHFRGGNKHSAVYYEMNGGGRTAQTPTVFLAHEEIRVARAVSNPALHENSISDVGLDGFEDVGHRLACAGGDQRQLAKERSCSIARLRCSQKLCE